MKVAFLGPEGTYTHQAVEQLFEDYKPVPCSTIRESIEKGETAVIPFENSLGGGVGESIDLLREKEDVSVSGEKRVEIEHVLASNTPEEEVEEVVSHPQALSQCRELIEANGWSEVEASSTASAARDLEEGQAAICSELAAEINRLEVLRDKVQDSESNTTRFLVVNGEEEETGDKTSLILEPNEDRPGILHSMLSCFSGHQINLSYIQSRPTENGLGEYYFYIEADVDRRSEQYRKALNCLETYSDVKTLGSYTRSR